MRQTFLIDADDTLWENNVYFERAIAQFISFLNHRERSAEEAWPDDDPVQNDANGSAKVALISLERSESSWRAIAQAGRDAQAADLEALAARLRALVGGEFPHAMAFVRPGFDEPWR